MVCIEAFLVSWRNLLYVQVTSSAKIINREGGPAFRSMRTEEPASIRKEGGSKGSDACLPVRTLLEFVAWVVHSVELQKSSEAAKGHCTDELLHLEMSVWPREYLQQDLEHVEMAGKRIKVSRLLGMQRGKPVRP